MDSKKLKLKLKPDISQDENNDDDIVISSEKKVVENNESEEKNNQDKLKLNAALDEFYRLKNNYEINSKKERKKILLQKKDLDKKQINKILKTKNKCVNCKRPVDTIIIVKKNKLTMKCGDTKKPCKLNININRAVCENIETENENLIETIQDIKTDIIKNKVEYLYGLVNEEDALKKFDDLESNYNSYNDIHYNLVDKIGDIKNNTKKNNKIKDLEIKLYYKIEILKENMKKFKDENYSNSQYVNENILIYNEQIIPLIKELQNLKYECMLVEENVNGEYSLKQDEVSFESLEYLMQEPKLL